MNIIKNFSVLILFFGIIILTVYITRTYSYKPEDINKYVDNNKENELLDFESKRPSKIFDNMFKNSTVWMGYSDPDTITKNLNNYTYFQSGEGIDTYSKFNNQRFKDL